MSAREQRVMVVGGGLAGLAATVRIVEAGLPVDLFSIVPVKRSHSVCAQGGINACNEVARQQGYSEYEHFDESIYGGDFLAHQPPVYEMAHWAPNIINLLDRMGVPFNRTAEGQRDLRLFGGSLYKRTHFAGATTGQQLIYALDEQVRRWEAEGKVKKYEHWEFLRPVVDAAGLTQGIVAQDLRTMQIRSFRGDAVVMATGGCGLVFGKSTNSVMCTGAAASRCYQHGAFYANGEFIQVHPTAIPGADKLRLMSESARGEGGRVWVPRKKGDNRDARQIPEAERWYFLEEKYPKYGNIVPRDIATREIFEVCVKLGMGVAGQNQVYLDLTHLGREYMDRKLGGILEIYRKFVGEEPSELPMRIFPGMHYSMGGLWTTYTAKPDAKGMVQGAPNSMMTNVNGLYAFGEVNYQYHGANRLGANALLSCLFDGLFCGAGVANFAKDRADTAAKAPASLFEGAVQAEESIAKGLIDGKGTENPYLIGKEMGEEMTAACTVVKDEQRLLQARGKIAELRERFSRVRLSDTGLWTNQNLSHARAVGDMLLIADAIVEGSLARKESRGSHFRTDFPERNDDQFMKTTVAKFNAAGGTAGISFEDLQTPLVQPRKRTYGKVEGAKPVPLCLRSAGERHAHECGLENDHSAHDELQCGEQRSSTNAPAVAARIDTLPHGDQPSHGEQRPRIEVALECLGVQALRHPHAQHRSQQQRGGPRVTDARRAFPQRRRHKRANTRKRDHRKASATGCRQRPRHLPDRTTPPPHLARALHHVRRRGAPRVLGHGATTHLVRRKHLAPVAAHRSTHGHGDHRHKHASNARASVQRHPRARQHQRSPATKRGQQHHHGGWIEHRLMERLKPRRHASTPHRKERAHARHRWHQHHREPPGTRGP